MEPRGDYTELAYVAPADENERRMAHWWEELLEVGPVGTADNFVELGGSSFSATALVGRVRSDVGLELDVKTVLASGSLRSLLDAISALEP